MHADATLDLQFSKLSTEVGAVSSLATLDCASAGEISPCALAIHDMFLGGPNLANYRSRVESPFAGPSKSGIRTLSA